MHVPAATYFILSTTQYPRFNASRQRFPLSSWCCTRKNGGFFKKPSEGI
jgi:hypothetical protein